MVPMSPMELAKTMEQRASNDRNRHAFEAWVQVAVSSGAAMSKVCRWTFWGFNDEMIISSLDMKYDIWAYDIMKYLGFMMWEQLKIMDHCAEIMGWLHIGAILPLGLRELKSSAGKSQWKNHAGIQKHLWRHICGCLMVFLWIFVAGVDSLHG